jgi:hypothetical protein
MLFPVTGSERSGLVSLEAKKKSGQLTWKLLGECLDRGSGLGLLIVAQGLKVPLGQALLAGCHLVYAAVDVRHDATTPTPASPSAARIFVEVR